MDIGKAIRDYIHVSDDSIYGKVKYLHNKYIASNDISTIRGNINSQSEGNHLSEDDIIRIAQNSKNGMRFNFFIDGGWEQFYDSQSEADLAFANDLAFWTAEDFNKMDSIFRDR